MPYLDYTTIGRMIECCYSLRLFSWPRVSCKNNSVRSSFYLVKLLVNLKMAILEFSRPEKANSGLSCVYPHLCRELPTIDGRRMLTRCFTVHTPYETSKSSGRHRMNGQHRTNPTQEHGQHGTTFWQKQCATPQNCWQPHWDLGTNKQIEPSSHCYAKAS